MDENKTAHEIKSQKRASRLRKVHQQLDKLYEELYEQDHTSEGYNARTNIAIAMDRLMIAVHYLEGDN